MTRSFTDADITKTIDRLANHPLKKGGHGERLDVALLSVALTQVLALLLEARSARRSASPPRP